MEHMQKDHSELHKETSSRTEAGSVFDKPKDYKESGNFVRKQPIKIKVPGFKSKMLLQVHDELVFDAHKSEVEEITPIIRKEMEKAHELIVPLVVDISTGNNWLEAH